MHARSHRNVNLRQRIVSRQEKMQLDIHVLESQGEIVSFELLFEGRK